MIMRQMPHKLVMASFDFYLIQNWIEQECIPVGCVPIAAVVIGGRGAPGSDPPQFPPWVWAWIWSPSISPLGVGLGLIPLNFPLGCGPGPDPPQFPPWVWAWQGGVSLVGDLLGRGSPWQGGLHGRGMSLVGGLLGRGCIPACTEADPPVNLLFTLDIFICSFHKCIQHTTRGQSKFSLSKLCFIVTYLLY